MFKRRLRVLKNPAVWGTALVLTATTLVFADYLRSSSLSNLAKLNNGQSNSGAISLDGLELGDTRLLQSDEDRAIAADIDTLPLLLNEFEAPEAEATPTDEATPEEIPSSTPTPLPSEIPGFPDQTDGVNYRRTDNPFALPKTGPGLLQTPSLGAAPLARSPVSPALSSIPISTPGYGASQPVVPESASVFEPSVSSPLQDALKRHQQIIPLEHTQGLPAATVLPGFSQPDSAGNGASQAGGTARLPMVTSPPLGSTGYMAPPTLRTGALPEATGTAPLGLSEDRPSRSSPFGATGVPPLIDPANSTP